MYDNMYYDDMYPTRYLGETPHYPYSDHRRSPVPEKRHVPSYDDCYPCPRPPIDHPMPMPNPVPMPEETLSAVEYLDNLFTKLMGKKVNIVIEGRHKTIECVKIVKVEDGVVVVELKTGNICVIPLDEVSAVCMSKELAQEYYHVQY